MNHVYPDIASLTAGLRAKNPAALQQLYQQYGGALNGIVSRMIPRKDMAEEVLQDCFLRIWDKIDMYDSDKGQLFTWMAQITRNICRDKIKSKDVSTLKKTDAIEDIVSIENKLLAQSGPISDGHIDKEQVQLQLRSEEWTVIDHVYFQGYTQRELSEKMDIPIGTVKTRVRMAINNLRKTILKK